MQTALSWIWTRVVMPISYEDNHSNTSAFYLTEHLHLKMKSSNLNLHSPAILINKMMVIYIVVYVWWYQ